MRPHVITVTNQKGGTGKTTLVALLAYGLALEGYNVLMVDLDPQAHLSSLFLKVTEIENVPDGAIQMAQDQSAGVNVRRVNLGDDVLGEVGLIPSGLNYVVMIFRGQIPSWDPFAIDIRISREPAIRRYHFIVCDTPPELFPPTLWGLFAADYIIIPSNVEELSLAGVKLLLREVIPEVVMRSRREPKVLGVAFTNVVDRYSNKTMARLENSMLRFVRSSLPSSVRARIHSKLLFESVIHRHAELRDLVYRPRRFELPLGRILRRNSELRNEVERFTDEVLERINNFRGLG